VPTPPTPPAPQPTFTGGGRYNYYTPKPKTVAASGAVIGSSVANGRISGRTATNGAIFGANTSKGFTRGTSRLSVAPIRYQIDVQARRRRVEDELLILELI
jgi:hypothetical protein